MKTLKKLSRHFCNTIAVLGLAICIFSTFHHMPASITEGQTIEDSAHEITPLSDYEFEIDGTL